MITCLIPFFMVGVQVAKRELPFNEAYSVDQGLDGG
jgi:hypothetical protein